MLQRSVEEECCGEVLEKSVVDRGVVERIVVEKGWRREL